MKKNKSNNEVALLQISSLPHSLFLCATELHWCPQYFEIKPASVFPSACFCGKLKKNVQAWKPPKIKSQGFNIATVY